MERIEVVKKRKKMINPKTEVKTDIPLGKIEDGIATLAVRRFLERWRKKYKKSVKHWFVTELGGKFTERIHLDRKSVV